jgi:hypothetical protein
LQNQSAAIIIPAYFSVTIVVLSPAFSLNRSTAAPEAAFCCRMMMKRGSDDRQPIEEGEQWPNNSM